MLTSVFIWATAIVGSTTLASCAPTEAPDGTEAAPRPFAVPSVTSIVALPRESAIVLAERDVICDTKSLYHFEIFLRSKHNRGSISDSSRIRWYAPTTIKHALRFGSSQVPAYLWKFF